MKLFRLLYRPGCMVGPKLLFSRDPYLALHRKLVFKAWPTRPRWQWALLLLASVIFWYLFSIWRKLFKCARLHMSGANQRYNLTSKRQWIDLLYLGLWLGVAPRDYYRLSLHQFARNRWCRFVFTQEQQTWHQVHSFSLSTSSRTLLADKYECEQRLRNSGINCVQTLDRVLKGDTVSETRFFQQQSRFIKPQSANAMRGCVLLEYDPASDSYSLIGKGMDSQPICESLQAGIMKQLKQILLRDSLLIQDVLSNSVAMSEFCRNEKLVTLRVISCCVNQAIELAYALLELESEKSDSWCIYPLDIDTGEIVDQPIRAESCVNLAKTNQKTKVPHWNEVQHHVIGAHQLFPCFKTIAWDLCVTEAGACIIEGNSGWGLSEPQIASGVPLLETKLFDTYTSD